MAINIPGPKRWRAPIGRRVASIAWLQRDSAPGLIAIIAAAALGTLLFPAAPVSAQTCTREEFAVAVDAAGVALRAFNSEMGPKIQTRLRELQKKKGWSDQDAEANTTRYLHDEQIAALDAEANELLSRIDEYGEVPNDRPPDCSRLAELEAAGRDLLSVMRRKSDHTLARIESALGEGTQPPDKPQPRVAAKTERDEKPSTSKPAKPSTTSAPSPARGPSRAAKPSGEGWGATTKAPPEPATRDIATASGAAPAPPAPNDVAALAPPPPGAEAADAYTIDEIRDATRGFFGTISTNLGSVIEYAFSSYGRPTGYVLGQEGGGAFLAGVRYGKGTLYMRSGTVLTVYWHGPSVGYDFGAEGSRTLFLIYRMQDPQKLFRHFSGVDGSAYLVGGVGLTLLKGGPVLMAPIRTGIGLRLGANVGYVRFTPHATWNPF